MDRDKVIKGLECCVKESEGYEEQCGECQYGAKGGGCIDRLLADTITLLKEQEDQIERLEYDLAVTQNNLNYYVNGND